MGSLWSQCFVESDELCDVIGLATVLTPCNEHCDPLLPAEDWTKLFMRVIITCHLITLSLEAACHSASQCAFLILGWERCARLLTEVHILSCWSVPLTITLSLTRYAATGVSVFVSVNII